MLGRLLWASPFIPDYKKKVAPIEALLSPSGPGAWTAECSAALNLLLRDVEPRLTLTIARPRDRVELHVSLGPTSGMVVLFQRREGGEVRVVGLVSRMLTAYELSRPPLERKLHLTRWALYKCRRFTTTSPEVEVYLDNAAEVVVLGHRTTHLPL